MNLCLNASDAMKDGGRLTLRTGGREDTVSISVSDTGAGMDAAVREQVFEPFFTTKPPGKGTGLGLPMVYGVVQSAGGDITLESAPGKGTTVTLTFPRAASKVADSRTSGIPPDPTEGPEFLRGRKVLLVDDEPLVLRAGIRMLNALGCEVVSAAGGREGVETFKRHRDGISLVVLDLLMPDLDGASALEQILETDKEIPVLLVSGFTHEVEKLDALQENRINVGFLAKPYRSEAFVTAARQLLETSS
jgi:CheY-like chemotaxis protein